MKSKRQNNNTSCRGKKGIKVTYISSPMKVKTSASNFRALVQQLTGQFSNVAEESHYHHHHIIDINNNNNNLDIFNSSSPSSSSLSLHSQEQLEEPQADFTTNSTFFDPSNQQLLLDFLGFEDLI